VANIIIKDKCDALGKTRSEIETNLYKEWGTRAMSEEKLDKLKFLERKRKEKWGFDKQFIGQDQVDRVK